MKYFVFVIAVTLCQVYGFNDGVLRFSVNDVEESVIKQIKLKDIIHRPVKARVGAFSYKNCGNPSTDILVLSELVLGPDPLTFPGDLNVNFKGVVKTTINAPPALVADVVLERRIGSTYIKIPCIDGIGSCHYDDLCEMLAGATCPKQFVDNNIPCKCPFSKGSYTLPKATFEVDAAVFPPGDYRAQGNVTYNGQAVGCIALTVSVD